MERYTGWSDDARALVERSAERHGGWALWERNPTVSLTLTSLSGMIPVMKGLGRTFPPMSRMRVAPHAFHLVFEDYPGPGERIEFDRGAVRVFDAGGALVSEEANHRRRFDGPRKLVPWTPSDAAYFFGYAVTYYQSMPFLLARTTLVSHTPARSGDGGSVVVDFAPDVVTHCTRQRIFFAKDGRIARHDYTADIIGFWARGAHFWEDYDESSGFLVARRRHVLPRLLGALVPGVALHADLADVQVSFS